MPWETKSNANKQPAAPQAPAVRVSDPGVLAVVNGVAVTQDTFRRRVEALPDDHPSGFMTQFGSVRLIHRKPKTPEERKVLLEELIKEELLVQDAVSLGLERDPDVRRQLEDSRRLLLITGLTQRDVKNTTVSDQEIEDHYNRFKEVYKEPERIHVSQIVTKTEEEAEAIRTHAVQGGDFAQLARERSLGAGKESGGDVGWYLKALDYQIQVQTGQRPSDKTFFPQLEAVAFSLEVGQISQPVKGPDGNYYLVKLEEQKPERVRPLSELHDTLRQGLLLQKQQKDLQDHLDRLWQKGKIEQNEPRLEQM